MTDTMTNWRHCLAYSISCVYGYIGNERVIDFLDILHDIYPFTDRGSKFDSIAGWLGDAYRTHHIITSGEYHDCVSALANNI